MLLLSTVKSYEAERWTVCGLFQRSQFIPYGSQVPSTTSIYGCTALGLFFFQLKHAELSMRKRFIFLLCPEPKAYSIETFLTVHPNEIPGNHCFFFWVAEESLGSPKLHWRPAVYKLCKLYCWRTPSPVKWPSQHGLPTHLGHNSWERFLVGKITYVEKEHKLSSYTGWL